MGRDGMKPNQKQLWNRHDAGGIAPATVVTIGGAMVDTIAVIDSERIERITLNNADKAFLLLEEGRKTEAALISTHPGGGAVNAAVSFARLGFKVSAIVKVGTDARAAMLKVALCAEGIGCNRVIETALAATGASVIISSHERNAAIFTYRGANSLIETTDITAAMFSQDIVYIAGLSDRSADIFPSVVAFAAANSAFIAANPGIRQLSAKGEAFYKTLSHLSLLSMNRQEATALIPRFINRTPKSTRERPPSDRAMPTLMRDGFCDNDAEMSLPHFIGALLDEGPQFILITDGKNGAYAANADEIVFCPSLPTQVIGTAGAGDAFTSTFAAMVSARESIGVALQYAAVNASSVVEHADTQTGLMRRAALEQKRLTHLQELGLQRWRLSAPFRDSAAAS